MMNQSVSRRWLMPACLVLLIGAVAVTTGAPVSAANTLHITSCADDGGPNTLRGQIQAAASGDTIVFDQDCTIPLANGTLTLAQDITIDGTGHTVVVDGSGSSTVFVIDSGVTANLSALTIQHGFVIGDGGGINNSGTLTATNSIISNNSATNGAGIYNSGTLTVDGSTISGNNAHSLQGSAGGGIYNWTGSVTVTNSTLSGNSSYGGVLSAHGGGIYNNSGGLSHDPGVLSVTNSTLFGNSAVVDVNPTGFQAYNAGYGGGISNAGSLSVTNSTLSGNSASSGTQTGQGGGIHNTSAATVTNTIVASNTSDNGPDLTGTITSGGHNLVGASDGSSGLTNGVDGNLVGTVASSIDPMIGPLTDNGGPTKTMALLPDSPAIDAGNDAVCNAAPVYGVDQREVSRPQGSHCDIGSFELEGANQLPVANPGGPYLGSVNTAIVFDSSASSDPDGNSLTYLWDFGDGESGTGATPSHSYAQAGMYDVCLTANDGTVDSVPVCTTVVIYDPSAGFVTGAGWIDSPAGACGANPSLSGKATFAFVSKYQKGTTLPTGNTLFQFQAAGLSFTSDSYQWLVISGSRAQFKGTGSLNHVSGYGFLLTARDGQINGGGGVDGFRIKITDPSGNVVYDNQIGSSDTSGNASPLGGGSIVIHAS